MFFLLVKEMYMSAKWEVEYNLHINATKLAMKLKDGPEHADQALLFYKSQPAHLNYVYAFLSQAGWELHNRLIGLEGIQDFLFGRSSLQIRMRLDMPVGSTVTDFIQYFHEFADAHDCDTDEIDISARFELRIRPDKFDYTTLPQITAAIDNVFVDHELAEF